MLDLRFKTAPLILVVVASWSIAFIEYCFAVPANRWGNDVYSPAQLKTIQEIVTLLVFAGFSTMYLREPLQWNHAVGFVLIAAVGLPGTLQVAGGLNLLIALVVWFLARPARHPVVEKRSSETRLGLLLAIAFFTGLASFVYEIGWIRMLSLVLGASTHSFELMLATFILGLDGDAGREPFELTREFIREHPGVWPHVNLPVPYGGTPLFDALRREGRLLTRMPFVGYHQPYMAIQLQHYDAAGFYAELLQVQETASSLPMMARHWAGRLRNRG